MVGLQLAGRDSKLKKSWLIWVGTLCLLLVLVVTLITRVQSERTFKIADSPSTSLDELSVHEVAIPATSGDEARQLDKSAAFRGTIDELLSLAESGDSRARLDLSDLILYRCSYVDGYNTVDEYRTYRENSSDSHEGSYLKEISDFDACRFLLSQTEVEEGVFEWASRLLQQSSDAGNRVAALRLAQAEGADEAAEFIELFPQVLLEDHPIPREILFNALSAREPTMLENPAVLGGWSLAMCSTNRECSIHDVVASLESELPLYQVREAQEISEELERSMESLESFNLLEN